MRLIRESFNVNVEDIYTNIEEVKRAYSDYKDALQSLQYYITVKYPEQAEQLDKFIQATYSDSDNIFDTLTQLETKLDIKESNVVMRKIKNHYKSINEASYGGAYDIEDDMFFTREEINEFAYELIDELESKFNKRYKPTGVYMESPNELYIAIMDEDGYESYYTLPINMRRIRKPQDLYKYQKQVLDYFIRDFLREYEWENRSYNESIKEEVLNEAPSGKLAKQITKLVNSGLSFNDAVNQVMTNHNLSKDDLDMRFAISQAKEFLGMNNTPTTTGRWIYSISDNIAKGLRSAIEEENYDGVCAMLQLAWEEIHEMMPEQFDSYELSSRINNLDMIENDEDEINYELEDFYDFCDGYKIWIPLK